MGNQPAKESNQPVKETFVPKKIRPVTHELVVKDDGSLECECLFPCQNRHIYNLHIEHHCPNLKPIDATGWPEKHFETVPFVSNTQRGVVALGDIDHASFVTVKLADDCDPLVVARALASLRSLTAQVANAPDGLVTSTKEHEASNTSRLVSLAAVHVDTWKRLASSQPKELRPFVEKRCYADDQVLFPVMDVDIILMCKSMHVHKCYELSQNFLQELGESAASFELTQGFRYQGGKDLTGFVDGTRNPDHLLRALVDQAVIFPDDDPLHVGGSYMYAGRFVHDLTKFRGMPENERDNVIGRKHGVVLPHEHGYDQRLENPRLPDEEVSSRAHTMRSHAAIYRQAYPYVRADGEQGLYFTAFARSLATVDDSLERMCGRGAHDGSADNLLGITTNVGSNYFYCPGYSELAGLPEHVEATHSKETPATPPQGAAEDDAAGEGEAAEAMVPDFTVTIEYCTNCGYKSIYDEKKAILEAVSPRVRVIYNPTMPRLSAFEIFGPNNEVIWSKLDSPDGRNNSPEVFPQNDVIVTKLRELLGIEDDGSIPLVPDQLYSEEGTRMGVW